MITQAFKNRFFSTIHQEDLLDLARPRDQRNDRDRTRGCRTGDARRPRFAKERASLQVELAKLLGVTHAMVSRSNDAKLRSQRRKCLKLAKLLQVSTETVGVKPISEPDAEALPSMAQAISEDPSSYPSVTKTD